MESGEICERGNRHIIVGIGVVVGVLLHSGVGLEEDVRVTVAAAIAVEV